MHQACGPFFDSLKKSLQVEMDIPTTLTSIATAVGILKQLNEIDAKVDEASFKMKIADISSLLADTKLRLIDAAEELREKDTEIKNLKQLLAFKAEHTVRARGFTYECDEGGTPKGVPFCPACEASGTMIKLVHYTTDRGMPWKCPKCKADYQIVPTYAE